MACLGKGLWLDWGPGLRKAQGTIRIQGALGVLGVGTEVVEVCAAGEDQSGAHCKMRVGLGQAGGRTARSGLGIQLGTQGMEWGMGYGDARNQTPKGWSCAVTMQHGRCRH